LLANKKINLTFVRTPQELIGADLVIIPGSKNVRADLDYLINNNWREAIVKHCRYGGKLLGICGGYQMLGRRICDPKGIESEPGENEGFGLLDIRTLIQRDKELKSVTGFFELQEKTGELCGYEIHCGKTEGKALRHPFCSLTDQNGDRYEDGCISDDGQIIGTYLHGLFETKCVTEAILHWVTGKKISSLDWNEVRNKELDRLADVLEMNLDIQEIIKIIEQ